MVSQSPVDRHKLQPFDLALGEQKPVERVAGVPLRTGRGYDVGNGNLQEIQSARLEVAGDDV